MSLVIQRETTEYIYVGFSGTPPSNGAEMAFLAPGQRPEESDWSDAHVVDEQHSLWEDASGSLELEGVYFVARLVGTYQSNGVELDPGDYQVWIRLTGETERPVRIAPSALEVE